MKHQRGVRICLAALLLCMVGVAAWQMFPQSQPTDTSLQAHVLRIADRLHAPGDQDTLTVATSSLATAEHIRYQIQQDLLRGMTDSQIMQSMEQQYGPSILAVPAMQGVGWLIWCGIWAALTGCATLAATTVYRSRRKRTHAHDTELEALSFDRPDADDVQQKLKPFL
ncbi:MAG: cytochrome c-type biogenesis protein CcmH [Alicyclobacillus sp.]|nr:cytochrome c-type biogenesis protein CcmH [Alicyclobacillus sp.]